MTPDLVIADEPVSALNVSIQAQILNLFRQLQEELDLTYLFIAHDLSVIRHISDRVAVMYVGKIVETGTVKQIFEAPLHPYTHALLAAVPLPNPTAPPPRLTLSGELSSPINPPGGCRLYGRCPLAGPECADPATALLPVVVLTTSREHLDIQQAYRLGANSYIRKPVDFERFLQTVGLLGEYWLDLNEATEPAAITY